MVSLLCVEGGVPIPSISVAACASPSAQARSYASLFGTNDEPPRMLRGRQNGRRGGCTCKFVCAWVGEFDQKQHVTRASKTCARHKLYLHHHIIDFHLASPCIMIIRRS